MSFVSSTRLMRWVIPCCSFLLVLFFATSWSQPNLDPSLSPESARQVPTIHTRLGAEAALLAKAEAVLASFGEEDPRAVVTVTTTSDWEDEESFVPIAQAKVLESIQTTGESHRGQADYHNTKSAENYLVGHTKKTIHRAGLRITRLNCLVQISPHNTHRLKEIERAVAVALGADVQRGDAVLAVAR